jgi:hypothetical protein
MSFGVSLEGTRAALSPLTFLRAVIASPDLSGRSNLSNLFALNAKRVQTIGSIANAKQPGGCGLPIPRAEILGIKHFTPAYYPEVIHESTNYFDSYIRALIRYW